MDGLTKIDHDLPDFGMSPRDLDGALTAAGFIELNSKNLHGISKVGEVIKNMGAIKIGRTKLLLSDEQITRVFQHCEGMLTTDCDKPDSDVIDMDQRIQVLQVMNSLAVSRVKAAEALINSAKVDLSDHAKTAGILPSFMPRAKSMTVVTADVILDEPQRPPDGNT